MKVRVSGRRKERTSQIKLRKKREVTKTCALSVPEIIRVLYLGQVALFRPSLFFFS
jgi:hypothetical protein